MFVVMFFNVFVSFYLKIIENEQWRVREKQRTNLFGSLKSESISHKQSTRELHITSELLIELSNKKKFLGHFIQFAFDVQNCNCNFKTAISPSPLNVTSISSSVPIFCYSANRVSSRSSRSMLVMLVIWGDADGFSSKWCRFIKLSL